MLDSFYWVEAIIVYYPNHIPKNYAIKYTNKEMESIYYISVFIGK
jgi:hypothetical protein